MIEIQLDDIADGGKAWAYLLHFSESPPARSKVALRELRPED